MTFVGNSPIKFRNIHHLGPLTSKNLANTLKEHDIFIFASKMEACSNALLEALHCGLPVIASNSSSNPEIINNAGELFQRPDEIPILLDRIVEKYTDYLNNISPPPIGDVAQQYLEFMHEICEKVKSGSYIPKRLGSLGLGMVLTKLFAWKFFAKLSHLSPS
ncbi:MAG: glycosyltransferase [Deltaproteobacteria bacterium]|nr:glycosyltransferase [Deltaproteobacteria bacterium]